MLRFVLLGLVLATYLVLACCYNAVVPLWEAPEEAANVEYVRYLQTSQTLPGPQATAPASTPPSVPGSEFDQVPLYYVALATILSPIQLPSEAIWHRNPYVTWVGNPYRYAVAFHRSDEAWPYQGLSGFVHAGRLVSTIFNLTALLATYALISRLAARPSLALFATAWLGWSPGFLLSSARVNNDAAAISFGALTLLACGHVLASPVSARPRDYAVMSAGLAGALLSKLDTFFLMPLVLAAAIVGGGPVARVSAGLSRRVVRVILVSTVPAALLAAWWVVYGHRFGAGLGRQAGFSAILPWTLFASVEWARMISAFATLNAAWWGAVGFDSSIAWPRWVNLAFALPFVILVAAGIALVVDGRRWHGDRRSIRVAIGWLYLAAAILIYATIARQVVPSIDYAANARFVLPASPAIALAVALGGSYLPLGRGRVPLAIGYLAAILGLAVATPLFLVPQLHVPTIPARLVRDERELTAPGVAHFSDDIDLLSIGGIPDSLLPGRPMPLHLLWRDDHPPAQNFVASVKFVRVADRQRLTGIDAVPNERLFPPVMWQPGEVVDDPRTVDIPANLEPGRYVLEVGAYYRDKGEKRRIPATIRGKTQDTVIVGSWLILPDASGLARSQPLDARFGPAMLLRGYDEEWAADHLTVRLYWESTRPIDHSFTVSVQILNPAGQMVAQHDGVPGVGHLPTTEWPADRVIRDDHTIAVSRGEDLSISVVVYDPATLQRLPLQGGAGSGDRLMLR